MGGFPIEQAVRVMVEAAIAFVQGTPQGSLTRVVFVLFTADALQAFEQALAQATA